MKSIFLFLISVVLLHAYPSVKIYTDISHLEKKYQDCFVRYESPIASFEDSCDIKLRGNTTALAKKKPYTLKLKKKRVVLENRPESKKWVLLSNPYDPTLLRNKLVFDFAKKLNFEWTPYAEFSNVYVNDTLKGVYLISEKVEAKKGRLTLSKTDFLIERDKRTSLGEIYLDSFDSTRFRIEHPSKLIEKDLEKLQDLLKNIEKVLKENDFQKISRVMNVPSFIDFWLVNEFFVQGEAHIGSNFFYFKDSVFYAGPIWDFDLALGNSSVNQEPEKFYLENVYFFKDLLRNKEFKQLAAKRFLELDAQISELYTSNKNKLSKIDSLLLKNQSAIDENYKIWNLKDSYSEYGKPVENTYEGTIAFLKQWLKKRHEFMRKWAKESL